MSSLLSILNTGRMGIGANQTALAVTGNNIANVNTAGYSRQRPDMQSQAQGGVRVADIQRLRDEFLSGRLQNATTSLGGSSVRSTNLQTIESLMNESEDSGTSKTIRDFFGALQNLSLNPGGQAERDTLRARGSQLATALGGLTDQLRQVRAQLDRQVSASVDRINSITGEIAAINQHIAQHDIAGQQPEANQMQDRRDALLEELAGTMPIRVVKDEQGVATVFGAGEVLVEGTHTRKLVTVADPANDGLHALAAADENGTMHALTINPTDGSLGAALQVRDAEAGKALDDIERLTASIVRAVNIQHRAGTGLDGVTGRDFFTGLGASAAASLGNRGGAAVTAATISNDTQINFDDYEIRFSAPGQFDVVNTTTGASVSTGNAYTSGAAINFAGMSITLSDGAGAPAAGDVFRINAYDGTSTRMGLSAAVAGDTRAIAAGLSNAPGDNRNASALAALLDTPTMGAALNQTFEDFFQQVRARISIDTQNAATAQGDAEISQQQVKGMADAVSGVSLDEEATNIIQFQRAFEASSRVVRTTDELMQTLLNMF